MTDINFPNEIYSFINGKTYTEDSVGMSDSGVLIFDDMVLKISPSNNTNFNEHMIMNWLWGSKIIPNLICYSSENGFDYLLMSKIPGKMSCDDEFMGNPDFLFGALADAMKALWETDISDCPIKNDLSTVLSMAEYRVEHGLVDVDDCEPETFGAGGFENPKELFEWLLANRPEEDFVLSHGDFCLPNIFIDDGEFSGFVDVGRMGIADRYQDIALCYRSLKHNFSGVYNGKTFGEFDEDKFFGFLGIKPDWDKIRYYILLDELF